VLQSVFVKNKKGSHSPPGFQMDLAQKAGTMGSFENSLEKFSAVGGLFLIFSGRENFQRQRRKNFSFVVGEA
jgi:hypothetical protein